MKYFYNPLIAIVLFGCSNPKQDPPIDNFKKLFAGELRIVDLTHSLNSTSPFWPNGTDQNSFSYTPISTHPSGASALGAYSTNEHNGTHLDAPIHFKDSLASVDEIAAKDLFAPVAVVDVSTKCSDDPDYRLTVKDIEDWEMRNGGLPNGVVVLMYTGWSKKWDDTKAYRNQDEEGKMHFPGFSVEVNEFLVNERNIKGIGIDNLSIDYGLSSSFAAHGVTNGAGKYHLENVAFLISAPIKIESGSGGQVRIFAILP